jgi:fructose-bisphosphate aldolase class I
LNEIVKRQNNSLPAGKQAWPLSFSYSRALQEEALRSWAGKDENIEFAQEAFLTRLIKVSKARKGEL